MKRRLLVVTLAAVMMSLPLLCGCSGGTTNTTSTSQDAEPPKVSGKISGTDEGTTESGDAEEALQEAQEAPSLAKEDLVGFWKVDDMTEEETEAVFVAYRFKKDGTFVMLVHAAGTTLKRLGTYEIRGDKAYVNVPEGASGEVNGKTYSAKEIKDAEIAVSGTTLTAKGISSNGTLTATKITKKAYEELVDKTAKFGPQRISVGETVTGEGYSFTINSFDFTDEIYPSDTSGYYRYYAYEDGKSYLVADVTFVNDGTEYAVPGYSTAALLMVGENKYNASVETDGGYNFLKSYSTDAKDSSRVIIYAQIPNKARDEGGEVKLFWSVPRNGALSNYYSNDGDNIKYQLVK